MALTLAQLQTPVTRDQVLQDILDELQVLGFNVTSWQSGSVQRTLLTAVAQTFASGTELVAAMVDFAFNDTSTGQGLTTFSDSHYDNQRVLVLATEGLVNLTGGAVGPPHTIVAGDVVVQDPTSGETFENTTGGVIPVSGTLTGVTFKARTPGINGNVANDTITELVTTFSGVTSNNPDPGSGTWITTLGIDQEADATLRTRNTTKWAVLNFAAPREAYVQLSLTADTDITRVTTDDSNPRGPGTVDVYIARATGVATAGDVTQVQSGTQDVSVDKKRTVSADVLVIAAAAQAITVTGTIHVTTSLNDATKQAEIEQAAIDYINSLDIGGEILPPATTGVVVFSELLGAITAVTGVRSVALSAPTADVAISGFSVATLAAPSFVYVDID